MDKKIGIIDHNYGNFSSVCNAINFLNVNYGIIKAPDEFKHYTHFILPGVGSYIELMKRLDSLNFLEEIYDLIKKNKFFLGICVGMQILTEYGEEFSISKGLKLINGSTIKMETNHRLPHVGWNEVFINKESILFNGILENSEFYFTHSFVVNCDSKYVSSNFNYGNRFISSIEKNNIYGVQFHPEKSQKNGLKLLNNFCNF